MGERHVGVEDGSGVENTVDKLANGGGAAVCRVAGICHGLLRWTLYNMIGVGEW